MVILRLSRPITFVDCLENIIRLKERRLFTRFLSLYIFMKLLMHALSAFRGKFVLLNDDRGVTTCS